MRRQRRQPISPDDEFRTGADAGALAAIYALQTAFGRDLHDARQASLIILHVPESSWVAPAAQAWQSTIQGGREPRRLGALRNESADVASFKWTTALQEDRGPIGLDELERALGLGIQVLVVAHQAAWVPPLVIALADIQTTLQPLSWRMLRYAAWKSAGLPTAHNLPEPSPSLLAGVSPRILRLATRSHGGAEGLLRRALVAAEASFPPAPPPYEQGPRGLARVPGLGPALQWGRELAADIRAYREGTLAWRDLDRGAVLAGPPGTGKTTFARALAEEAGVPLIATSYAEWQGARDGHLGTTLAAMQSAFKRARASAPCILFVDELDSLPNRDLVRHDHADYVRSVVNGFLAELDGAVPREGVVVIGACNNATVVDPAILRSGRLERHIAVNLPDTAGLEAILRLHLDGELVSISLTAAVLEAVAQRASGADCERWVREARRSARVDRTPLSFDHLRAAIVGEVESTRTPEEMRRVALHEAGHAVAAELLRPGTVCSVSIRESGSNLGSVATAVPSATELTAAGVHTLIVVALAGRAAEEVLLGAPGGGAGGGSESDLARATALAAASAISLGHETDAGLVWRGCPRPQDVPRVLAAHPEMGRIVRARLDAAYVDALVLVREHQAEMLAIMAELVRAGTLDGEQVRSFLGHQVGCKTALFDAALTTGPFPSNIRSGSV